MSAFHRDQFDFDAVQQRIPELQCKSGEYSSNSASFPFANLIRGNSETDGIPPRLHGLDEDTSDSGSSRHRITCRCSVSPCRQDEQGRVAPSIPQKTHTPASTCDAICRRHEDAGESHATLSQSIRRANGRHAPPLGARQGVIKPTEFASVCRTHVYWTTADVRMSSTWW